MSERKTEWGVGVALGVLMTQFPLRGGPPICEWNRQDLAKKSKIGESEQEVVYGTRRGY